MEPQTAHFTSFDGFEVDRVLSDNARTKTTAVSGRFHGKEGEALVLLSRQHFDTTSLPSLLSSARTTEVQFQNDIYAKCTASIPVEAGCINIDVTYPATEKHISKATEQKFFMVSESPADYRDITLPFIEAIPQSRLQWVYNIIEKKAEADRLIFEDEHPDLRFVLHPDMKWDQTQVESLYCIAIVHRKDIRSLRDLRQEHLPLLRNIKTKATQAIVEKYGVRADELRTFLHYQPSYYHLHVHLMHIKSDYGAGMACGKAHLLDDVIDSIALVSDYYARRTLTFSLGERDPLMDPFRKRKAPAACSAEDG